MLKQKLVIKQFVNINKDEKTSNWNEKTKEVEISDELVIDEETGEIVDDSKIGHDDVAQGLFSK